MKTYQWMGAAIVIGVGAAAVAVQKHGGLAQGVQAHVAQAHGAPASEAHEVTGHMVSESVEIPLRLHEGKLTVQVDTEDGGALEFIVSTANGATVVSKTGEKRIGDSGISVAGLEVPTEHMQTISDESLTTGGTLFDGILGANFLNQFDVLIDAPNERLVLKKPGRSTEWEGMTLSDPVRVRLLHGMLVTLDVDLNGHTYPAVFDSGTSSLFVNERVKTDASLEDDGVSTLKLGNTTHAGLRTVVENLPIMERFSPNGDGFVLVGAPLAYECALSISYVRQELRTCVR